MKNTQKGFISIAAIIGIIIGALIVGGATYVVVNKQAYNRDSNAPKDQSSGQSAGIKTDDDDDGQPAEVNFDTSSTVQTETSISVSPTEISWKEYVWSYETGTAKKVVFQHPSNWEVLEGADRSGEVSLTVRPKMVVTTGISEYHSDEFITISKAASGECTVATIGMKVNCFGKIKTTTGSVDPAFIKIYEQIVASVKIS